MIDQKDTNPKDMIGQTKLSMDLVPESAVAEMSLSFLEGALKYGRFNWRSKGVRASIYYSAMRRHMSKWYNGEDEDADTHVSHLASVMACCAIIIDAKLMGKLNDDRPPKAPVSEQINAYMEKVKHLQELFKDEDPYQYTIADSESNLPRDYMEEVLGPCIDDSMPALRAAIEANPPKGCDKVVMPDIDMNDYQGCHTRQPDKKDVKFVIKDAEKGESFKELEKQLWEAGRDAYLKSMKETDVSFAMLHDLHCNSSKKVEALSDGEVV